MGKQESTEHLPDWTRPQGTSERLDLLEASLDPIFVSLCQQIDQKTPEGARQFSYLARILQTNGITNYDGTMLPYYNNGDEFWRNVGRQHLVLPASKEMELPRSYLKDCYYLVLLVDKSNFKSPKDVKKIGIVDPQGNVMIEQNGVMRSLTKEQLLEQNPWCSQILVLEVERGKKYSTAERVLKSNRLKYKDGRQAPAEQAIPLLSKSTVTVGERQERYEIPSAMINILNKLTPNPQLQRRIIATLIAETGYGWAYKTAEEVALVTGNDYLRSKITSTGQAQLSKYAIPAFEDWFARQNSESIKQFSVQLQNLYKTYLERKKSGALQTQIGNIKTYIPYEEIQPYFETLEGAIVGAYLVNQENENPIESAYTIWGEGKYPGIDNTDVQIAVDSSYNTGTKPQIVAGQQYNLDSIGRALEIVNDQKPFDIDGHLGPKTVELATLIFQKEGYNFTQQEIEQVYGGHARIENLLDPNNKIVKAIKEIHQKRAGRKAVLLIPEAALRSRKDIKVGNRGLLIQKQVERITEQDLHLLEERQNPQEYESFLQEQELRDYYASDLGKGLLKRRRQFSEQVEATLKKEEFKELRGLRYFFEAQAFQESGHRALAVSEYGYAGYMQMGVVAAMENGIPIGHIFKGEEWLQKQKELMIQHPDEWTRYQTEIYTPALKTALKKAIDSGDPNAIREIDWRFDQKQNIENSLKHFLSIKHDFEKSGIELSEEEVVDLTKIGYNDIGYMAILSIMKYGFITEKNLKQDMSLADFQTKSSKVRRQSGENIAATFLSTLDYAIQNNKRPVYWYSEKSKTYRKLWPEVIKIGTRYLQMTRKREKEYRMVDAFSA